MSALDQLINQDAGVMPYVRFDRVPVEDAAASRDAGHYVARDVDFAYVTPPYSKDVMKHKVESWFAQLKVDATNGRIPGEWLTKYQAGYEAWKKGQELPLDGFPIKGWGVISPAQQETLIRLHILTVEQLAACNDEGLRRIGMGSVDLKNKATAWLKQLKKAGPATQEVAALQKENSVLKASIESLEKRVQELTKFVELAKMSEPAQAGIAASDFLED